MPYKIAYPWFFFSRVAQLSLLVFLPSLLLVLFFDPHVFLKVLPFSLVSYVVFIYLVYKATKPLGTVLAKVLKFKDEIPFDQTLRLLYKDEWAQVEAALNKADRKLQDQVNQAKTENEKIRTILESIYDNIIAIDNFETVLFYNSNFKRNFMQSRSQGEILAKVWHTFSDEQVLKAFRDVLETGQTVSLKGMNFLSPRHPDRWFDLTITPLMNGEGKVSGALGVFYDVTEFKLTEQMRVDFVANVSHEIRTPLTSIKGYSQVLQSQARNFDPELQGFISKILANTERMISLFNDLLSLSVIESNIHVRLEVFPLLPMLESVLENVSTSYSERKIELTHELQLPMLKGDPRLMEQVMTNLIDNACKYSGDDLSINVSTFEKNGKAHLTVADNGPGISKEHLQRIFERFYRIDSSRETSRGTGLGLSIVKHIVVKHGGRIWAESESRRGTTFIIELPLE